MDKMAKRAGASASAPPGAAARKRSTHLVYVVSLLAIGCAALSGVSLRLAPPALLALHLFSSIAGVAPLAAFLARHWWSRRYEAGHRAERIQGYVALSSLALLALTGLALIPWTNVPALRWLHAGATVALLLDLTVHMAWRIRLHRPAAQEQGHSSPGLAPCAWQNWRWLAANLVAAGIVVALTLVARASATSSPETPIKLEHASLGTGMLARADDCELCHTDITQQWRRSGHAHAATDAYYQAVTALFMEERGAEAVRFCATCHNPVGLVRGEVDLNLAKSGTAAGGVAYEARRLGVSLPISQRATEGVTCALCHQASAIDPLPANGSLHVDAGAFAPPADAFASLSLRAAPDAHRAALLRPVIRQAELCGSCHNLRLPDNGLAVERTFDEWRNSPYPVRGITCQSCHMPQLTAAKSDSGLPQAVKAHGIFPGAPSSLPGMPDDATLLQQAATIDVSLSTSAAGPSSLLATVTLTNSGAGHNLPTGANDLRQMWLELTLLDGQGQMVWNSGVLDEHGQFDPSVVQFRKVLGDATGRPIDLHRIWVANQVLEDTSLEPMETRRIIYPIRPTMSAQAPFTLTARLLYRDVPHAFAEFALDRAIPAHGVPVREMVRARALLPSLAGSSHSAVAQKGEKTTQTPSPIRRQIPDTTSVKGDG